MSDTFEFIDAEYAISTSINNTESPSITTDVRVAGCFPVRVLRLAEQAGIGDFAPA